MKKILGVALLGLLLLAATLKIASRKEQGDSAGSPPLPSAVAPAPAAPPVTPITAAPTLAVAPPSDAASCAHLDDLCSTSDHKVDVADCQTRLADARKMSGASNVERSETCMVEAKTCAAASGCLSGGVGMGTVGEFLKGLGASLSK